MTVGLSLEHRFSFNFPRGSASFLAKTVRKTRELGALSRDCAATYVPSAGATQRLARETEDFVIPHATRACAHFAQCIRLVFNVAIDKTFFSFVFVFFTQNVIVDVRNVLTWLWQKYTRCNLLWKSVRETGKHGVKLSDSTIRFER